MSLEVRRGGEGFSDSLSLDFADPESGAAALVLVDLRPGDRHARGVEVLLDGEVTAVAVPELTGEVPPDWSEVTVDGLRIAYDGEHATASLAGDAGEIELEARRTGGVALENGSAFAEATGLTHEAFSANVTGEWRRAGTSRRIDLPGHLVRTSGAPDWDRIELIRLLTAVADDGSLLAVASARPHGAAGHGEEATSALLLDSEGSVSSFDEALLSTEYDAAGYHRRAGVELWGADEATAVRGAGTRIGEAAAGELHTAFLRFSLQGTPGTARYDLLTGA